MRGSRYYWSSLLVTAGRNTASPEDDVNRLNQVILERAMKKVLVVPLTDEELLDLCRILLDRDEQDALRFLDEHLKKPTNEALEGG
ncbi:MAG: hypothetical protein WBW48_17015 [Anaerolineae bacterium]